MQIGRIKAGHIFLNAPRGVKFLSMTINSVYMYFCAIFVRFFAIRMTAFVW